jgi:hypothetical protein
MKGGVYILIGISVLMAASITIASGYTYLQAKIVPILVGGVILILALMELIKELRAGKASAALNKKPLEAEPEEHFHAYLREAAWMVGFCAMIYLVGFLVGIVVFTAAYAKAHKTGWSTSLLLGIGMAGTSYLLFSYLTENELYLGLIWQLFGGGS